MKIACFFGALILPLMLCSCRTPGDVTSAPVSSHPSLVITSADSDSGQIILPQVLDPAPEPRVLDQARTFPARDIAIVILENYSEPQPGPLFQHRSVMWFMGLRNLGYQHIIFLRGHGVAAPEGLPVIARYD